VDHKSSLCLPGRHKPGKILLFVTCAATDTQVMK
jgi:hypothetical protein